MTMDEQKEQQIAKDLINQMFTIAGHKVTYVDVINRIDNWWLEWTMTEIQCNEWKSWGEKHLIKKLKFTKVKAKQYMNMFNFKFGLKCCDCFGGHRAISL